MLRSLFVSLLILCSCVDFANAASIGGSGISGIPSRISGPFDVGVDLTEGDQPVPTTTTDETISGDWEWTGAYIKSTLNGVATNTECFGSGGSNDDAYFLSQGRDLDSNLTCTLFGFDRSSNVVEISSRKTTDGTVFHNGIFYVKNELKVDGTTAVGSDDPNQDLLVLTSSANVDNLSIKYERDGGTAKYLGVNSSDALVFGTSADLSTGDEVLTSATAPSLAADNVFTGSFNEFSNAAPILKITETGATVNEGLWRIYADSDQFNLAAVSDDELTVTDFMDINRTGTTVDSLILSGTSVQSSGNFGAGGTPSTRLHARSTGTTTTRTENTTASVTVDVVATSTGGVIGTPTNHLLDIYTNNTQKIRVQTNGNTHIGGTSDNGYKLEVTGTANISGALTAASFNGNVLENGTWTPTESNPTNLDSYSVLNGARYSRMGSLVTVSFAISIDPTVTNTTTSFEFTLPIASDFTASQARGNCNTSIQDWGGNISAVIANDTFKFTVTPISTSTIIYQCIAQYEIA